MKQEMINSRLSPSEVNNFLLSEIDLNLFAVEKSHDANLLDSIQLLDIISKRIKLLKIRIKNCKSVLDTKTDF